MPRFNAPRMAQACAWLLAQHGPMDPPQLMHYLYLADRRSLLTQGALIVGGPIVATEFGPVHEMAVGPLLGITRDDPYIQSLVLPPAEHPGSCALAPHLDAKTVNASLGLLSQSDEECLAWAIAHGADQHAPSEMHAIFAGLLPEWSTAMLQGTQLPIQDILVANGLPVMPSRALVEHLEEMDRLTETLDNMRTLEAATRGATLS